jgi:hypothetical protein
MQIPNQILDLIFPKGTSEWFELKDGWREEEEEFKGTTHIVLQEKDIPPFTEENKHKKIIARKFHEITINDYPLRGRKTLVTFRRRYWKVEGEEKYLKRDIKLTSKGTQLETEFGNFLKEDGR